ncbi:MAG: AtpZ/AtpI family protein [Mailhella sp.]|nr:AtpZ/AtpI family protein [Mailhella sp.]MBQ9105912.1 AtpZ/AtpI family protein [Mailhella sp.]
MSENSPEKAPGNFSLLGTASTMGLHMVSGPVVGGGLGYLIDGWLDSWPVASSIGFLLGIASGFRNVWADARHLERSNALIDEERKKKEEEAVIASSASSPKQVHKVQKSVEELRSGEAESMRDEDVFMASLLSGTASSAERPLEEQDETVEAIRRVLQGEDSLKERFEGTQKDRSRIRNGHF